jgi:hypothetical protein
MEVTREAVMGEGPPARAVYYALDDSPSHVYQLRRSVASVRHFNREITIYVAFWGPLPAELRAWLERFDVRILRHPSAQAPRSPLFLKWMALGHRFEEAEVVFLDTDTVVHSDISELFQAAGPQDFHARVETACHREPYPVLSGPGLITASQIDHDLMDRIRHRLHATELPVFNSGIMVFKNGFHRVLATRLSEFERIRSLFLRKRLPYPCSNAHIIDEIVSSLILGRVDEVTWSEIKPDVCPFYIEHRSRNATDSVLATHVWSFYYPAYIFETYGSEEFRKYADLGRARIGWGIRLTNLWIRVGGSILRAPGFVTRAWLAIPPARL